MTMRGVDQEGVIATQLAILMPGLLLLVMLGVQFALWAHATQLADAAADAAATAAALPDGVPSQGEAAAAGLLSQTGHLGDVDIRVERGPSQATATVSGIAPQVVPGFRWHVTARAAAPIELFVPESQR